jgi:hypothetical protein
MRTRLLTVTAALMLTAGFAGAASAAASATGGGPIPRTCFNGQLVGTVIDNNSPIYKNSNLTGVNGFANAGDTFEILIVGTAESRHE